MDNIRDIVRGVIKNIAQEKPTNHEKLERTWKEILNQQERAHTQIVQFRQGQVWIAVDSPAWVYALNMKKGKLLEQLRQQLPEIQGLHFKIGKVE